MYKTLKNRIPGFGILQVFVLIVIFGIVALIIQSMINGYQRNLKSQQLLHSRDLIGEMLNGTLINSVAAISYTVSKCGTPSDIVAFPQNPLFCLCMKEKACLNSGTAIDATPDGFPFVLYRSDPSITTVSAIAGGMVSFCAASATAECSAQALRSNYLDPKICATALGLLSGHACVGTSDPAQPAGTGIPASYGAKIPDAKNFVNNPLGSSTAERITKLFNVTLGIGAASDSMLLLPQNMLRYSTKGERCMQNASENILKYIERCPFSVDLRFKADCSGATHCGYSSDKIHICYTIHHDSFAGGAPIALISNINATNGTCTTLARIIENAAGKNTTTTGGSSSSGSSTPGSGSSSSGLTGSPPSSSSFPGSESSSSTNGLPNSSSVSSASSTSIAIYSSTSVGTSASSSSRPNYSAPLYGGGNITSGKASSIIAACNSICAAEASSRSVLFDPSPYNGLTATYNMDTGQYCCTCPAVPPGVPFAATQEVPDSIPPGVPYGFLNNGNCSQLDYDFLKPRGGDQQDTVFQCDSFPSSLPIPTIRGRYSEGTNTYCGGAEIRFTCNYEGSSLAHVYQCGSFQRDSSMDRDRLANILCNDDPQNYKDHFCNVLNPTCNCTLETSSPNWCSGQGLGCATTNYGNCNSWSTHYEAFCCGRVYKNNNNVPCNNMHYPPLASDFTCTNCSSSSMSASSSSH